MCVPNLRTVVIEQTNNHVQVGYQVGYQVGKNTGLFKVSIDKDHSDRKIIAELLVLKKLIIGREVLGQGRTGNNLTVGISCGAIKKLANDTSTKTHLKPYSRFLRIRFNGIKFNVSNDTSWFNRESLEPEQLKVNYPHKDLISTECLGDVVISEHAFERCQTRMDAKRPDRVYRKLCKLLRKDCLRVASLPAHVLKEKAKKYKKEIGEIWEDPETNWRFVLITKSTHRVLVTAYPNMH